MPDSTRNPVSLGHIQRLPGDIFLCDSKLFVADEVLLGILGREGRDCFGILDI